MTRPAVKIYQGQSLAVWLYLIKGLRPVMEGPAITSMKYEVWIMSPLNEGLVRRGPEPDCTVTTALHWRHNRHDSVSNHQPYDYLLNRLFRRRSKKISKLRVTGLCAGNSPETGEFPHKWPVTRKMFPFDDVMDPDRAVLITIMKRYI